jgi:hypothetical protein
MAATPIAAVAYSGPVMSLATFAAPTTSAVAAREVLGKVFGYAEFRGPQ